MIEEYDKSCSNKTEYHECVERVGSGTKMITSSLLNSMENTMKEIEFLYEVLTIFERKTSVNKSHSAQVVHKFLKQPLVARWVFLSPYHPYYHRDALFNNQFHLKDVVRTKHKLSGYRK